MQDRLCVSIDGLGQRLFNKGRTTATQQFDFNECAYNKVMEKGNGGYLNSLAEELLGDAIRYMLRYKSALFQDKANEMIVTKCQRYDAKAKKLDEARGLNAVMARNAKSR